MVLVANAEAVNATTSERAAIIPTNTPGLKDTGSLIHDTVQSMVDNPIHGRGKGTLNENFALGASASISSVNEFPHRVLQSLQNPQWSVLAQVHRILLFLFWSLNSADFFLQFFLKKTFLITHSICKDLNIRASAY
uniref:Uncharacterized protein n=1 Tax=Gibberella zeae (strain ATCC MYA-4620 / CBS 123657 / FGSC 9075 / NRRL 31084 / PH-1) TaxID=229533 RepID=A0A098D023_GIBZE